MKERDPTKESLFPEMMSDVVTMKDSFIKRDL